MAGIPSGVDSGLKVYSSSTLRAAAAADSSSWRSLRFLRGPDLPVTVSCAFLFITWSNSSSSDPSSAAGGGSTRIRLAPGIRNIGSFSGTSISE